MPPRPFGLKINVEVAAPPAAQCRQDVTASLQFNSDGTCAMLGRSLTGHYVFSDQGLIKSAGQDAPNYKVCEQDIVLLKELGAGACAKVHKGYHKPLQKFVAVKRVSATDKEVRQQMLRDIKILSDAQHVAGLVGFCGAYFIPKTDQLAIVLEYMDGGTLADVLKKVGRLPEDVMAHITAKLLHGLVFMHAKHMVHRDIKPANILMSLSGDAKLSDFGIAAQVDHTLQNCKTFTGTVTYMSPERLEGKPYNFKGDIWGLGLVLLECLTGRYPYHAAAASGVPLEIIAHVCHEEVPLPPPGSISDLCRDFLTACLQKDPAKRPAAALLLNHPWITQAAPVNLRGLLKQTMWDEDEKMSEIAYHFSFTYFKMLSDAWAQGGTLQQMICLYEEHSVLSYQGELFQGRTAIISRLQQAVQETGPNITWHISSIDSQALGSGDKSVQTGCIIAHVRGRLELSTAATATAAAGGLQRCGLAASFIFAHLPDGCWYVANQMVRLVA
jgi:serine/threonine protein kinase